MCFSHIAQARTKIFYYVDFKNFWWMVFNQDSKSIFHSKPFLVFFILATFKILCIMSCCNNTFYIRDLKSFMGWWLMVGRRWESFDSNLDTEHSDGFTTISAWHQLVITKERVPELSFLFISIMLWSVRRANLDKGGLECYCIHFPTWYGKFFSDSYSFVKGCCYIRSHVWRQRFESWHNDTFQVFVIVKLVKLSGYSPGLSSSHTYSAQPCLSAILGWWKTLVWSGWRSGSCQGRSGLLGRARIATSSQNICQSKPWS